MHQLLKTIELPDLSHLIDAINKRHAVVFVGAGASVAAGMPIWSQFLSHCLNIAKERYKESYAKKFRIAEKRLEECDYLVAAELIQQGMGGSVLNEIISAYFGRKNKPTDIHNLIARIPFSMAVTTNFDKLLENAYVKIPNSVTIDAAVTTLSWSDGKSIIKSVKKSEFCIIKAHGDAGTHNTVLNQDKYKILMRDQLYNHGLATLLSSSNFLFVGCSLRDPDILSLLDEAKNLYGEDFGPHYAFLFESEVDDAYLEYLKRTYSINVILSRIKGSPDDLTESVCSFLKHLSGEISIRSTVGLKANEVHQPTFNFNETVQSVLREVLMCTGSESGKIAFIESRDLPGLRFKFQDDYSADRVGDFRVSEIDNSSLRDDDDFLMAVYLHGTGQQGGLYLTDIRDQEVFHLNKNIKLKYRPASTNAKSVLVTHIFSDGQPVGVLCIESTIADAYTNLHLLTMQRLTFSLGSVFKELELRAKSLKEIDLRSNAVGLQAALDECRVLQAYDISYLFYEIDHRSGKLIAHYDHGKVKTKREESFEYDFEKSTLANHVHKTQKELYITDLKDSRISPVGIEFFGIEGPIYAAPIKVGHYISFILIAWSRKGRPLLDVCSRIYRLSHFLVNSPDRSLSNKILSANDKSKIFIEKMNEAIGKGQMSPFAFREKGYDAIVGLLKCLQYCGIARVRLWLHNEVDDNFTCIYSYSVEEASYPPEPGSLVNSATERKLPQPTPVSEGSELELVQENAFTGSVTNSSDPYCRFTLNRFNDNFYAMHQHRNMFAVKDLNNVPLKKDPKGKWIVGPIVYERKLIGYISADNHYPEKTEAGLVPKERKLTEREDAFQRYAIDLVSDILRKSLKLYRNVLSHKSSRVS